MTRVLVPALVIVVLLRGAARANAETPAPASLADIDVTEHLGAKLPLAAPFFDSNGRAVRLSDLARDERPLLLVIAYYRCPMLCGLVLSGVAHTVGSLDWKPGKEFRIVTISFDPEEGPKEAKVREATLSGIDWPGPKEAREATVSGIDWPFWTGDRSSVRLLLDALGVRVRRDEATGQFAHPAVFFAITPDGRISRYLYGIDVPRRDVKLALLEAGQGKTGSAFERLLLRCFMYDPATRRYGIFIARFLKVGGSVILFAISALLVILFRRERRVSVPLT